MWLQCAVFIQIISQCGIIILQILLFRIVSKRQGISNFDIERLVLDAFINDMSFVTDRHFIADPADGIPGDIAGCIDHLGDLSAFLICLFDFFFRRIRYGGVKDFDVQSFCDFERFLLRQVRTVQDYVHGISPFFIKEENILPGVSAVNIIGIVIAEDVDFHSLDRNRFNKVVFIKSVMERILLRPAHFVKFSRIIRDDAHASAGFIIVPF